MEVSHPPERDLPDVERAARAVEDLLEALGAPVHDDPELESTGRRVAEAFARELLSGYRMDPAEILSEATATDAPGLVLVRDLPLATTCPHHLMAAEGVAHIAYVPGGRVAGFGAVGRLLDCFSRRLALQEDLGQNVADALVQHLRARGAGCILELSPTCLTARGGRRHGARAVTYAWAGEMARDASARREVLLGLTLSRGESSGSGG